MKQFILTLKFLTLILLHIPASFVTAQVENNSDATADPPSQVLLLTRSDSIALARLPLLLPPEGMLKATLPAVHDNAGQPFFMPLFEQVSNECGQYAAISYNFCYEINRSRGTSASEPENQYPTHYTYNFMNGGYGWYGVSYFHSFEVARVNGHPSVADFGTMNSCGPSYWMSGYEKYRSGMENKIENVYQIRVGTPEGLLVLKNWLHNHLSGEETGGIACFYSSSPWNLDVLPQGTPEGGRHVITGFIGPAGHACTISGYNDSIRYDYNQDGQYTNDIDLNGDGLLDMRDWELGGLRFTDSYIDGVNWADSGFAYMMYKTLADRNGEGGIWNNAVHVVTVREDYEPLISLKTTIEHNCRDRIRIMAGVADDASGTVQHSMGFPIFNYQGACQHLQGGFEPVARTLELGLDITPLLQHLRPGQEGAVFLLVEEDDPYHQGTGKIKDLAVIDHMHDDQEWVFAGSDVPLQENGLTVVGIPLTLEFDKLLITTGSLPVAHTGEEYSQQLEAAGGNPPYSWELVRHYTEESVQGTVPAVSGEELQVSDTIHGRALCVLDFEFPFHGRTYDSIWVHTDGFILFDDQDYPWPYLYDEELMIRNTRVIAPCLNTKLYIGSIGNDGIRYEGDASKAAFRWTMTATQPAGKKFDFVMELYTTGEVRIYTPGEQFGQDRTWAAGLSAGDGTSYQIASYTEGLPPTEDLVTTFTPEPFPEGIMISETGLLHGTPQENFPGLDLMFQVNDDNAVSSRRVLPFHSYYAGTGDQYLAGSRLTLSPVPSDGELHLELDLARPAALTIELTDLTGRVHWKSAPTRFPAGQVKHTLNPLELRAAPGVWLLKVSAGPTVLGIRKVILMH